MMGLVANEGDFREDDDKKFSKKKRKRQSDGKSDQREAKSGMNVIKSPNGSTIKDFFSDASPKPAKKMRTLDEIFASCPKKDETVNNVSEDKATPKRKQSAIVDLTTPKPIVKPLLKLSKGASSGTISDRIQDKSFCASPKRAKVSKTRKRNVKQRMTKKKVDDLETTPTTTPTKSAGTDSKTLKKTTRNRVKPSKKRISESDTSETGMKCQGSTRNEKTEDSVSGNNCSSRNFLQDFAQKMRNPPKSPATKTSSLKIREQHTKMKNTKKKKANAENASDSNKNSMRDMKKIREVEISSKKSAKPRKSSSDGVVFVAELKRPKKLPTTPSKSDISMPQQKSLVNIEATPSENLLWTEKYSPKLSKEIIGNCGSVDKLVTWLKEWRQRWEKEQREISNSENTKAGKVNDGDDSDSDFELDPNDRKTLAEDDAFRKAGVIIGPTGCGKTSAIFACAQELGFKVFEMNASSQRSSKQILSRLHEATQSHQVSKTNNNMNFFIVKENSKKPDGNSLILFKDVDILFEEDKFFWSAINTLITDTKRPIILTMSDSSALANLEQKHEKFLFGPPSIDKQLVCLKDIAHKESFDITEKCLSDVRMANRLLRCDLRKTIHALHFWAAGNGAAEAENSLVMETGTSGQNQVKKAKKRRRSSRRKSKSAETVEANNVFNSESKILGSDTPALEDFFSKTCGIFDTLSRAKKELCNSNSDTALPNSGITSLFTLVQNSALDERKGIDFAERAVSTMIAANMPQIIKINWLDLLQVFDAPVSYSAGKKPLSIPVSHELSEPSTDIEFTYNFSPDEITPTILQEQTADFLMDEDSVDVCYDSKNSLFPCVTSLDSKNPSQRIRNTASNSAKNKMDVHILDTISTMADMCCLTDHLEYAFTKGQRSFVLQPLDGSRCKIKDGLSDVLPIENELSHQNEMMYYDIQAAIQVRSMEHCFSQLSDIPHGNLAVPNELPLRQPHEGKTRRNHCYLRHSLRSKFVGGSYTTTKGFTLDYLPMIRSISRSENFREESKKKRRFLHYFNSIRVFLKPAEMSRLVNDFMEVTDENRK